jgi:uncharacterized membrane protein AbrB (regulator of aidB expression)
VSRTVWFVHVLLIAALIWVGAMIGNDLANNASDRVRSLLPDLLASLALIVAAATTSVILAKQKSGSDRSEF